MARLIHLSRANSKDLWAALALAGFVLVFLLPIVSQRHPALYDDGLREMLPGMIAVARSIQSGSLPLWDFCTFAGARPPYASNFLLNFYPPMYPFFLMADTDDPVQSHFMIMLLPLVLHLMWAAVGGYVFGRAVLKLRRNGAWVLGLLYGLSPEMGSQLVTIPPAILFSHLPWCLLALAKYMETGRFRWWWLSTIFLALMNAAGCTNFLIRVFFMMSVTVGWLWLFQLRDARGRSKSKRHAPDRPRVGQSTARLAAAASTFVVAMGLNGFAWGGLVEGIGWMTDAVGLTAKLASSVFEDSSMHPLNVTTLFFPECFGVLDKHGWGICTDYGMSSLLTLPGGMFIVVASASALLTNWRGRRGARLMRRRWSIIAATLLCFALLTMMGRFTPVFTWLCNVLPWFFRFPHPIYYRFAVCWNLAILAGIGVSALASKRYSAEAKTWMKSIVVCVVAGLIAMAVSLSWDTKVFHRFGVSNMNGLQALTLYGEWGWFFSRPVARFLVASALIVGLLKICQGRWRTIGFTAGIVAETCFLAYSVFYLDDMLDQQRLPPAYASQPIDPPPHAYRLGRPQDSPYFKIVDFARERTNSERVRYVSFFSPFDNYCAYADGRALFGYSAKPLIPHYQSLVDKCTDGAPYMLHPTRCSEQMLQNMNVGYFVAFQGTEMITQKVTDPLPYVYTQTIGDMRGDDEQLNRLLNSDLRRAVYLQQCDVNKNKLTAMRDPSSDLDGTDYKSSFTALQKDNVVERVDQSRANRNLIEVTIKQPAMLVIVECWHPGWTARVDGQAAYVHRVNYLQQGVWLEPGRHIVELVFFPASVWYGFLISIASAGILLIAPIGVLARSAASRHKSFS